MPFAVFSYVTYTLITYAALKEAIKFILRIHFGIVLIQYHPYYYPAHLAFWTFVLIWDGLFIYTTHTERKIGPPFPFHMLLPFLATVITCSQGAILTLPFRFLLRK